MFPRRSEYGRDVKIIVRRYVDLQYICSANDSRQQMYEVFRYSAGNKMPEKICLRYFKLSQTYFKLSLR